MAISEEAKPALPGWNYTPKVPLAVSPLFQWPLRPLAILRWTWDSWFLISERLIIVAIAFATLLWTLPPLEVTQTLRFGWIVQVWLTNIALLTVVASALHIYFYRFCIKPTPFRALSKKFHRQEHASVRSRRRGRHTMPFCAEPGDPIWKTRDGRKDRAHDSRTGLAWLASRRRDLFDHAEWPAVRAVYVAGWASPAPNSNSVPSTHILCINTASLRANATLARLAPRRFTSRSAQAFKADGLTRNVMIAFAAS